MRFYSAEHVAELLPYRELVDALRDAFKHAATVPLRTMHTMELSPAEPAMLALMPAWNQSSLAIKLATVFPGNERHDLPTVQATIVLFNGVNGEPLAVVEGTEVTRRRTAAASALAATFLASSEAQRLLIVGTGSLAPHLAMAHSAVRQIRQVEIWGRAAVKARAVADALRNTGCTMFVRAVEDLEQAVRQADVISCATSAGTPLVSGHWLKPGAFLDLVGAYTPNTRECDDEAVRRARIYVDTLSGALSEAGDILIPIGNGTIQKSDVVGDLQGLCRGDIGGRRTKQEITLFKSVGTALEDLAAAQLVAARDGLF